MKIGLFLHKINTFTHTAGVWGENLWANAMVKGFEKLGHVATAYGENMGYFPKEVDLAIYFHSDLPSFENPVGKQNVAIFHNWNAQILLETRLKPYLDFKGKVATISKVLAIRHNWLFLVPCVDLDFFHSVEHDESYNYDLAFIGNAIKEPDLCVKFLSKPRKDLKYGIFGNGFNKVLSHEDSLKIYTASLANLSFTMKECFALDGLIARPFQISACKGLVISDKLPTLMEIFGDSMLYAENSIDILRHIEWLVDNSETRDKMREKAYQIVKENYNSEVSMRKLLEWVYKC